MDAFQASNPDAAIVTAYVAQVGNVEIASRDLGSADWDWAAQIRVQHQARWSFLLLWDDDQADDPCPAGRSCANVDYKVEYDAQPFPSLNYCPFMDSCWDTPSLSAKIRPDGGAGTVAHEIGHIVGAPDEYGGSNCNCGGDYGIWRVDNSGCYQCSSAACLMKSATLGNGAGGAGFAYDAPTLMQWGWNDHDGDGAFLVMDPVYSYTMAIDKVQPGDLVVINHPDGTLARRIAVTSRNSAPCALGNSTCSNNFLLWEGFTEEHQSGQYVSGLFVVQIYRNGALFNTSQRVMEATATYNEIANVSVPIGQLNFQFRKRRSSDNVEVAGASYLLARVVRTSDNAEVHRFVNHDFSPTGSYSFSTAVLPRGVFTVKLLAWTPGGPNSSVNQPLRTLPAVSLAGPSGVGVAGSVSWTASATRCIGTCDAIQIWCRDDGQSTFSLVSSSGTYITSFATNTATGFQLKAVVTDANTDGVTDTHEYYQYVSVNTYPFTASISGPLSIAPSTNATWSAVTTGGVPALGYEWRRQYLDPNPGPWELVGTATEWVGGSFQGACTPFDLQLDVLDGIGRQQSSTIHADVQNRPGGTGPACLEGDMSFSYAASEIMPTRFELSQDVASASSGGTAPEPGLRRLTTAPNAAPAIRGSLHTTGAPATAGQATRRLSQTGIMAVSFGVPRPATASAEPNGEVRANAVATSGSGGVPVHMHIFDSRGRLVRTAVDEVLQPGYYQYSWDGRSVGGQKLVPGVYTVVLSAPGVRKRTKLIMVH